MTIDDNIKDEKLQHDINREAPKISTLSTSKVGKYEYLRGGEILSSDPNRMIEQAKVTYSLWGKAFEIQRKTIEDSAEKQWKALETSNSHQQLKTVVSLFLKDFLNAEDKYELEKFKKIQQEINRDDLIYQTGNKKKK